MDEVLSGNRGKTTTVSRPTPSSTGRAFTRSEVLVKARLVPTAKQIRAEDTVREADLHTKGWLSAPFKGIGKMVAAPVVKTKDALAEYQNRDRSFHAAITEIAVEFDRKFTNPTGVTVLFTWETGKFTATQQSVSHEFGRGEVLGKSVLRARLDRPPFSMDGRVLDYQVTCTVTLTPAGSGREFGRKGEWVLEGGKFRQDDRRGDWVDLGKLKKADAKDPTDTLPGVSKVRIFVQSRDPDR